MTLARNCAHDCAHAQECPRIPGAGRDTCCDSCDVDGGADGATCEGTCATWERCPSATASPPPTPPSPLHRWKRESLPPKCLHRISVGNCGTMTSVRDAALNKLLLFLSVGSLLLCTVLSQASPNGVTTPPTITRQPRKYDIVFDAREDLEMTCEADGDPKPTYSWTKNGVQIDFDSLPRFTIKGNKRPSGEVEGTGSFEIRGPEQLDEGYYQCLATNTHGISLTNVVHLREAFLDQMPKVTTPQVRSVGLNRHVSLTCTPPKGLPEADIFWTLGGEDSEFNSLEMTKSKTTDHDGNLHFLSVQQEDSSEHPYSCNIFNPVMRSIQQGDDQIIEINTNDVGGDVEPELLWGSPINTIAMKGKKLRLKCIFAGSPIPEVTWTKTLGNELPKKTSFQSYNQEIVIRRVDFTDQGQYECTGSNGIGSPKTRMITVQVQSKPFFTVKPTDKNGAEEETHSVVCEADGSPEPDVQLYRNGIPIEDLNLDNSSRHSISPGRITIAGLLRDVDTAVFQCNASNAHGYVFADAYLNVLAEPPMFTQKPDPKLRVVETKDAELRCRTFGAPKPAITWSRGAQLLSGDQYTFQENGDLRIKAVRHSDQGVYTCIASNKFGDISAQGELDVFSQTRILMAPEDVTARAGTSATFRCSAEGDEDLPISIEWLKDGEEIEEGGRPAVKASKNVLHHAEASIIIPDITDSDSGIYTCVAKTELDSVEEAAEMVVQDVPQPPSQPEILQCRAREAVITWTPGRDGRSPILNYIIQSNTEFEPDVWTDLDTDVQSNTFQQEVELSPWANYTFRIYARNKLGVSKPSEVSVKCITPGDTPDKNPTGVKGQGSSPSNMVIDWKPMLKIEQNGPEFRYQVKYRLQDTEPPAQWETIVIQNPMETEMIVPNQPTYAPYDIMVIAYNKWGQSKEVATVRTGWSGEAMPESPPQNFGCAPPSTPTTARCTWDEVPRALLRGKPVGYKIQFWVKEEGEASMVEQDFPYDISEGSVTLLKPFSNMVLQIRVRNSLYESDPSPQLELRTPEGLPSPVQKLRAIPVGVDQFKVTWLPPRDRNGELHGYRILYREVDGLKLGDEVAFSGNIPPSAKSAKITGLKEKTVYRITVKAYTSVGDGKENFCEETTTVLEPPDPPIMMVHQVEDKALNISIVPARTENPGSHFFVEYKAASDDRWIKSERLDPTQNQFVELNNLDPGTAYTVRVVASNGPQSMKISKETTVTTSGEDVSSIILVPEAKGGDEDEFGGDGEEGKKEEEGEEGEREKGEGEEETVIIIEEEEDGLKEKKGGNEEGKKGGKEEEERGGKIGTTKHDEDRGEGKPDEFPPTERPDTKFAAATWFIVLLIIIILLIIILIVVCLVKRNRGGRYPVQKKELEAGCDPERDGDAGFGEFTRTEDDQDLLRGSQGSLDGSLKPVESDLDSLAAYGDGEGGKFNEDGSFIGQYGPDKKRSNAVCYSV